MSPKSTRKMVGGADVGSSLIGIVTVLVALYLLYLLYNWIFTKGKPASTISLSGSTTLQANKATMRKNSAGDSYAAVTDLSGVTDGGQYSVDLWTYVTDTKGFLSAGSSSLANLLEIGNRDSKGNTLLYIGLNPVNAALIVRQNTITEQINNTLTAPDSSGNYPLSDLIKNYNSGTKYSSRNKCDIVNGIEYQRWILITIVANARVLDVYIDGKLARSCVYSSPYSLSKTGATGAKAYIGLGNNNNLKAFFSNANYYNHALTPEAIWRNYQYGPSGPFNLSKWIKSFFSLNYKFNSPSLNTMDECAACNM
jgi:hypothetical protein